MVKGRQGERIRLYVRGTVLGYKRSKSNQYPNTSLVQIEGVNIKEEVAWYAGKRLAYIYKAKVKRDGSHYRCIWGKVTRPHGNSGVVRAKFTSNLPPKSTTTVTEKREDEATSKPCSREPTTTTHKWNRSPSRKRPVIADANVSGGNERRIKSPARRPSPSPEKKMKNGSRLVRGRESGSVANRKVNAGSTGVRRDSGEGSGRRSRSPSCSRTVGVSSKIGVGVGRNQAPAKKSESEEVGEINDIVCNVTEKKSESEECEEKNDIVSQVESIENPHVSMKCFIFL
ncbi:unnamed protein product [Vicia faba]|uniref:Uncharacterized protein n=1 Tax=Vicia faba TaxID=3906 RepID=A0AAV0ZT85_VICFA|nr:unnamed protein product [Vicia faba]